MNKMNDYIRAGFAGLYLITFEEIRAEAKLKSLAEDLKYDLFRWSITQGILNSSTGTTQPIIDPVEAVNAINNLPEKSILVLADFHQFLIDAPPLITRALKDAIRIARSTARVIVIMGCTLHLPKELEKEFTIVNCNLPDLDQLKIIARNLLTSAGLEHDLKTDAIHAARGLSSQEAEDIFSLSLVQKLSLDPKLIAREKAKAVKKDGPVCHLHQNPALCPVFRQIEIGRYDAVEPRFDGIVLLGPIGLQDSQSSEKLRRGVRLRSSSAECG